MRRVLTGTDADGRSTILEDGEVEAEEVAGLIGLRSGSLWTSDGEPPGPAPAQAGRPNDVALAPGAVRWFLVDHDPPSIAGRPEICVEMHHQDALELVHILSGSTTLVVDTGETVLYAGHAAVLPGVDHAFLTGADGCRMLAVALGLPPAP